MEVLDKQRESLELPLFIRRLGPDAFKDVENLLLTAWSLDQVDNWLPILKARRLTLQIGTDIWLPVSPIGGFEAAFCPGERSDRKSDGTAASDKRVGGTAGSDRRVGGTAGSGREVNETAESDRRTDRAEDCLSGEKYLDFEVYDNRLSRIQDGALKLEIALSRLLYPCCLSEKAEAACRQLVIRRFRPAMLQLVSGRWNRYHRIPERAESLLRLKKMDQFLKKELLKTAAEWGAVGFVRLLTRIFAEEAGKQINTIDRKRPTEDKMTEDERRFMRLDDPVRKEKHIREQAFEALYDRVPGLVVFSDLIDRYESGLTMDLLDKTDSSFMEKLIQKHEHGSMVNLVKKKEEAICLARVYAHHLFHWMYMHPFQKEEISDEEEWSAKTPKRWEERTGYAEKLWDLACDIAVEYMVDRIFGPVDQTLYKEAGPDEDREGGKSVNYSLAWKRQMILDRLYHRNPVMTGEHIRKQLAGWQLSLEEVEEWSDLFKQGDHSWWDADCIGEKTGFRADAYRREAKVRWEAALQKWADSGEGLKQIKRGQTGRQSAASGHSQEEAKLTKRQGYDFHTYLKQFMVMREDRLLDLDSFDPVYYTYGLCHYQDMPFVEPLETKEVLRLEELVIVIDTSGSCSGRLVRFFLEETWSVFGQEENFFDHFHVRILQCDSVVQEDVKLTSIREAEQYMSSMMIKGGGGTDFRAAFTYIRRLQEKGELMHLKGILYFTDGFGTFPASAPGCRTTFVFLKSRFGEVDVPVWADKLLLPLPEGAGWEPEYTGAFQANI